MIRDDPKSVEIIKPILVGSDIGRYGINFQQRYLIWTYIGVDINRYPAIARHLSQFQDRLEQRWDKGNHWYELRTCTYYEDFEKSRIIYPDIAETCRFAYDGSGFFSANTTYFIPGQDSYLLSVLNSSLSYFYFKTHCAALEDAKRRTWLRFFGQYMELFPVRRIDFTTPADERQRYAGEGQRLYDQFCATNDYAPVRGFVARHLDAGRSDVAHDLLATLAEQMITMHKEKQEHLRAFHLDLAGYLDERQLAKLNRLYTPKKPPQEGIKNYDKRLAAYEQAVALAQAQLGPLAEETLDLDDFWRLSQAHWMWLLRQNLGQVAHMSDLVRVYQQYHDRLAPLMRRIGRTDRLINQVVYQLYGLTEEEIKVVEGRA